MVKLLLRVIFPLLILSAMSAVPLAQDSEEPCSSRETVYPVVKTAILDDASYQGLRVRYAAVGERLDIIGSKRFGPWCWLQVSDGWLIDSVRALSSEPRDAARQSARKIDRACYQADTAYIGGPMNIRTYATTNSPVVAHAGFGDAFEVLESRMGEKYCWLRIVQGWMARTTRVLTTEPKITPTPVPEPASAAVPAPAEIGAPHHIVNSQGRHIPIYGNDVFRHAIASAFYYLRDNLPQWWTYVSIIDDVKYGDGICYGGFACAGWPYKVVLFEHDLSGEAASSIALTLIHEACHIYQWQGGKGDNYDWSVDWEDRAHEQECVSKEREAGF